jgi:hypothetical protein
MVWFAVTPALQAKRGGVVLREVGKDEFDLEPRAWPRQHVRTRISVVVSNFLLFREADVHMWGTDLASTRKLWTSWSRTASLGAICRRTLPMTHATVTQCHVARAGLRTPLEPKALFVSNEWKCP